MITTNSNLILSQCKIILKEIILYKKCYFKNVLIIEDMSCPPKSLSIVSLSIKFNPVWNFLSTPSLSDIFSNFFMCVEPC